MKYNFLGSTGVLVSELSFGAMTFGGKGIFELVGKQQQKEVNELLATAVEAGINFFDTANVYSNGESERLLGEGIRQIDVNRNDLFIATKVLSRMGKGVNQIGLSRLHIFQSVEESLKRLQLDHIDLLYVHGVDLYTPVEQIVRTLHDLVMTGKVRYIGVCNWPAWMVMKALAVADRHGWHRFTAMQYYYSAVGRDVEFDLIPLAQDQQLGFLPWSPLAGGFLTGKFTREKENTGGGSRRDQLNFPPIEKNVAYDVIDIMNDISRSHNVSVAEIGLAWVRQQKGITSTIIGAKNVEQLQTNIHSTSLELSREDINRINEAAKIRVPYPQWIMDYAGGDRLPK